MQAPDILERARDAVTVKRVYGEPYEKDGVTVIPAAAVQGGGGGGGSETADAKGSGGGFGVNARPVGAWLLEGDTVRWKPALDLTRVVLLAELIVLAAVVTRRPRRR